MNTLLSARDQTRRRTQGLPADTRSPRRYLLNYKRVQAVPFVPDGSEPSNESRLRAAGLQLMAQRGFVVKMSDNDIERKARRNERMLREREI